jgi:hypothetical protein
MSVKIKPITLWRTEVENKPGILARTLEPLASTHADLAVVMGYRYPGAGEKAAIELYPVTGKKTVAAAKGLGLGLRPPPRPRSWLRGTTNRAWGMSLQRRLGMLESTWDFLLPR